MLPKIYIGQFGISTYYSAMFLGYVMMVVLMLSETRRKRLGIGRGKAFLFATAVLILGVLGCKILYILESLDEVRKVGISCGGFSFFGSVFLIPLLIVPIGKPLGLSGRDSLDSSAICILAMLATIRLGCFLNGCCGGRPIDIGGSSVTFPTQIIECAFDCVILVYLLKCERKKKFRGYLYPIFLLLYGIVRFPIEILRDTPKDWLYLSHAQWFSLASIAVGLFFELRRRKQPVKRAEKKK